MGFKNVFVDRNARQRLIDCLLGMLTTSFSLTNLDSVSTKHQKSLIKSDAFCFLLRFCRLKQERRNPANHTTLFVIIRVLVVVELKKASILANPIISQISNSRAEAKRRRSNAFY